MNLDSSIFALTQIDILVRKLKSENLDSVWSVVSDLIRIYGSLAERQFLYSLISLVVQQDEKTSTHNTSTSGEDQLSPAPDFVTAARKLLETKYKVDFTHPTVTTALSATLEKSEQPAEYFLNRFITALNLSSIDAVVCAIALQSHATALTLFVDEKVAALVREILVQENSSSEIQQVLLQKISQLHAILQYLYQHPEGLSLEERNRFIDRIKSAFIQHGTCPKILLPFLTKYSAPATESVEEMEPEVGGSVNNAQSVNMTFDPGVVEFVLEHGTGICATVEECRATLMTVGTNKINPATVARIINGMLKAQDVLNLQTQNSQHQNIWGDTPPLSSSSGKDKLSGDSAGSMWNGKVFVQAVLELVPNFAWKDVFRELDFPGFFVKDGNGFRALMEALKYGLHLQGQARPEQFPIDSFYRRWINTEGQLSLIRSCLNPANSDIFSFADYPYHSVSVDMLKTSGEKTYDMKEISVWKSIELLDLLLSLSDGGHYSVVQEIFQFPVLHCPDILLVGLIQISSPMNMLRQELMGVLFPVFLNNHVNSGVILQYAWHSGPSSIRPIMMHAMAEWYLRGDYDQTRLSRILDVAQDLKVLHLLLNANSFIFIIDLACLASRREFLKLDKWLSDKIREHGEPFVASLVKVLNRRAPYILGKEESIPKAVQLSPETVGTMIQCLHQCIGKVNHELGETIISMVTTYNMLLNKSRPIPPQPQQQQQRPPGVMRPQHGNVNPLEAAFSINPSPTPGQLFPPQPDPLAALGTSLAGLNLSGNTSNAASFGYNPLGPTPGSPSRLLGPNFNSQNPGRIPNALWFTTWTRWGWGGPNVSAASAALMGGMANPMGMLSTRLGASNPSGPGAAAGPSQPSAIGSAPAGPAEKRGLPDNALLFSEIQPGEISKEAEDEANSYFHRIYSKHPDPTMSIDEVLDLLKRFQDSAIRREREVFTCMLRNLFDEYKFFPQYPDKELHTTAQLFGGIIEHGLVTTYLQLGVALRFVVDALKKAPGSKMYYFGLAAVDRFKSRLKEYPQYCQHLASIPHFQEFPSHLIEYIEYGTRSQEPPRTRSGPTPMAPIGTTGTSVNGSTSASTVSNQQATTTAVGTKAGVTSSTAVTAPKTASSVAPGPSISGRPSIANATNITTLLVATEKDEKITPPPEGIQDKTAFIFNNLNQMNLTPKCEELKEVIGTDYWPWVSQYLVMKRASIELNFHTLYSNLLDSLKTKELNVQVLKETHRNIKILLRTDKSAGNFSDRALLKNLGHWLGMITLMKNKAIILDDLDIKSLIVEAYRKGLQDLLYVVPFAAKIMESCARSIVFKPPCPWTMGIMNVLGELHREPEMKLNLKFEIEVLCKALNIEVGELQPQGILKDDVAYKIMVPQLSYAQRDREQSSLSSTPTLPSVSQEPKFSYMDVDTSNLNGLLAHIAINNQLPLFQANPGLKQNVRPSIEKAIQELLHPVVDRSIKYTISACEQIIKKDFALDPEENRMRAAAHHMMRYLTAGMAMITSRDHIFLAISGNLKSAFLAGLRNPNPSQQVKDMAEQASSLIATENMELACAFMQKTAVEKSLLEIDKRLAQEYEARKQAKLEGRRYCDPQMLSYQMERMPEPIRVKPVAASGPVSQQLAVYEDFSRNIPGFLPPSEGEIPFLTPKFPGLPISTPVPAVISNALPPNAITQTQQPAAADDLVSIYDKLIAELDIHLQGLALSHSPANILIFSVLPVLSALDAIVIARSSRSVVAAITLLQKAVEGLLEGLAAFPNDAEILRFRDAHLMVLKALQDTRAFGQQWVNRQVTKCLIESRPELKYNTEAVDTLIRANLVNMLQFDAHLATAMEKGTNVLAMAFAMQLVQMYLVDERYSTSVTESDLYHTVDMLARCATVNRQHPEGLVHLIEVLRNSHESSSFGGDRVPGAATLHSGMSQSRDYDDPQGLVEKSEILLREWIRLYLTQGTPRDSNKAFATFVPELNGAGILKSDEVINRFFRICVQCCINQVYQGLQAGGLSLVRGKCYQSVDALVRLVALLIKNIGDTVAVQPKVNILNKFLGIVAGILIQDHEVQKNDFQQLPFHRLFIMLFYDLNMSDPVFEAIGMQILAGFSNILHILNPSKVPGFAYAWLEIIGNRMFIARMLALAADQKCWAMYCQLLLDLFKFLQPFLRNAELAKPVATLYRGTLRVLLVILHDFPDFLCDYCYHFLDAIPPNCIQMRNLVLSAFPRNMRLPDPFTANLKFEMLADTAMPPRILSNVGAMIQPPKFKQDLDSYLKTRAPVTFLSELRTNLQVTNEMGTRYNIPLLNALVLYVGSQHITVIRQRGQTPNMSTVAHTSHMDIFQNLAVDLDTEGRYLFLNALSNQLRFPSSHTHYFSLVILYLFAQSNTEVVQEQITRVLLERLVVNRPHPWGLLVTFIELIKNPTYKFWQHEFVHCAPEVEKLFESVARSCMVTKANSGPPSGNQSVLGGGNSNASGPGSNGSGMLVLDTSPEGLNVE
ncbi:CCR4-NOT transcription complex subunit 1 [Orchesella cincta]|uniref:CCR4-NOT transcription complex subunit 1 n=1 Tax=Orchesella cincta TaxID=48709 RepID=A0A1D2NHC3_ORCCI|nr:CCR4-NOT transcription complex subunit 1 [Orchesella cincta]